MATQTKRNRKNAKDTQDMSDLSVFDRAAKSIFSVLDTGYADKVLLNKKDQKFRDVLNRELDIAKGYSHGSIVDFVNSVRIGKQNKVKDGKAPDKNPGYSTDIFTKNINDVFGYFQDIYKNRFIEITDLKFVAKFIPALGEAVKTTLDSIVSSDNISETINFKFELPSGISSEDRTAILNEIARMEKELKLRKKLKNITYRKTLVTGMHYIYQVPYNRIFEEYDARKRKKDKQKNRNNQFGGPSPIWNRDKVGTTESYMLGDVDVTPAMENIQHILMESDTKSGKRMDSKTVKTTMQDFYDAMPEIHCDDSIIYSEAVESVSALYEMPGAMEAFRKKRNSASKKIEPLEMHLPDGTVGEDEALRSQKYDIGGTYIKYIDPKQLVPIKIFDQIIGYFLIHPKDKKKSPRSSFGEVGGITSIGNSLFSSLNIGETKKHDAIQRIIDTISEGILENFDKKFVTDNATYKKLIADVIIANGLTDKDYNIQFIPESDIIPFTIQENEDGMGESILSDSLFPAKLLLSMIVTRMLNYINKSGNKTIAHIHRGPINALDTNQLQRVIRDLQDEDITFNDLLSPNLVFNKFNRNGNMVIPATRDGTRLVDFEVQDGQQIDMKPEYEQTLENMAIMGTGVPTVIMEYAGSADFAKQIVSANIKFAGRIASLQSDLEEPTTILYRALCQNSNLTDQQKAICAQSLEVKLPRPRVAINSNNAEFTSTLQQTCEAIADLVLGRDTINDTTWNPNGARVKEKLMLEIAKMDSPFIEWDEFIEIANKIKIEVEEEVLKRPKEGSDTTGGNGGSDMNF